VIAKEMLHQIWHWHWPFAVLARLANESLSHDAGHGGREQIGLDAHFEQPRHCCDGAVRMQRREYEVTDQRCFDRGAERLRVANLADHDDVGILAEDRAQSLRKG